MDVGLPAEVGLTMQFRPDVEKLPRLGRNSHYQRIGIDGPVPICLDEQNGGSVVADEEDEKGNGSKRFINSNAERFSECLTYYEQYRRSVRGAPEAKALRLAAAAEARMRMADPAAFGEPEFWWPLIIEQTRNGFL